MSTISMVLSVIMAIVGIILCIVIMLQSDRNAGLGTIGGGASTASSDSYWSKNKSNSIEGALSNYTKILAAIFIILGIVINFVRWLTKESMPYGQGSLFLF